MSFISVLAQTFQVSEFDVMVILGMIGATLGLYYFYKIHTIFESAFGAISGLSIYILLSVLLLGNGPLGTEGGLFPFGFSVFIVSISVYLIFLLAVLFPLHGGLVTTEPKEPILYSLQYFSTAFYLVFSLFSVLIYMIEQSYVFKVGTIFVVFRDMPYYLEVVKASFIYSFIMSHQGIIVPLGVMLMLYKLLLSNIINAALLSVWYNLSHVGFYRPKDDAHYRVEFHEVGGGGHDDHGDAHDSHSVDSHKDNSHHH